MFLIAKIVRGRRLLHELEKQEKDEHDTSQVVQASRQLFHESSIGDENHHHHRGSCHIKKRSRTVRKKTPNSSSIDSAQGLENGKACRKSSSMPSIFDAEQATSSNALKHYNYDNKLSKIQKRAIRFTWHRLQTRNGGKRVENVFDEVFEKLIRLLPKIRDMFSTRMFLCAMSRGNTSSLRDHSRNTVKMIDAVIKNLDVEKNKRTETGTEFDPIFIGRAHIGLKPYGLTGNYWEKFGEVMIDVVLAQEAVRDLPGAGQAWVIFTACLIDQLRAGFEEVRRNDNDNNMRKNTVLHHATQELLQDVPTSSDQCPVLLQNNNIEKKLADMNVEPARTDSTTDNELDSSDTIYL